MMKLSVALKILVRSKWKQNWGPQMNFLGALVDDHTMAVIIMMILTMAIILTLTMMIMVTDMMVTEQAGQ